MRRAYQKNCIRSRPMAATPAAEPMIRMESSGAGAIGDKFPEKAVWRILSEAIHAHRCRHERNVVDDSTQEALAGEPPKFLAEGRAEVVVPRAFFAQFPTRINREKFLTNREFSRQKREFSWRK